MPNRILKESICYSDDLDCLTAFEETVFYRLIVRVDDYGRLDARPAFLRSQLFTTRVDVDEDMLGAAIDRLAEVGLIARYTVADKPYLYICTWQKHQRVRSYREKYPAPPDGAATSTAAPGGERPPTAATGGERPPTAATGGEWPPTAARAGAESESKSETESESESESVSQAKSESGAGRFIPPTVEMVETYCRKRNNGVDARRFVDFYASKGWLVGISPMADWRAAIRRWEVRDAVRGGTAARASPQQPGCLVSTAKNYESEDCI